MDKLFRQVSVKERLPEKEGKYHTNVGLVYYHGKEFYHWIEWWLEEVELPSEEDMVKITAHYINNPYSDNSFNNRKQSFKDGANYILNTLKGEKR